jgi:hypothetical protein
MCSSHQTFFLTFDFHKGTKLTVKFRGGILINCEWFLFVSSLFTWLYLDFTLWQFMISSTSEGVCNFYNKIRKGVTHTQMYFDFHKGTKLTVKFRGGILINCEWNPLSPNVCESNWGYCVMLNFLYKIRFRSSQKKCLVWRAHDNVMDYTFHLLYYWGNEIWRPIPKCNLYSYLRLYNFQMSVNLIGVIV